MSRNLSSVTSSAIPVGSIIDAAGLSNVATVDGGTFARVNSAETFYSESLFPAAAKSLLDENYLLSSIADPSLTTALGTVTQLNIAAPPATLTGIRSFTYGNTSGGALTFNSGGYALAPFGVTGLGNGFSLSSNGTTMVAYYGATDTTVRAVTSTNGIAWTDSALTSASTFSSLSGKFFGASPNSSAQYGAGGRFSGSAGVQMGFWFGARFVLAAVNGANYTACISTNGTTFGGDATTAVLGGTGIANSTEGYWYRNSNAGFFVLGTSARRTTDGGATWANITNPPAATDYHKANATAPAKLTALADSSTTLRVSADSGATWTSRTLPFTSSITTTTNGTSIAYFGSVGILVSGGAAYVSTNDFAAIANLATPSGITGSPVATFADANRIYTYYSSNQIAITTDGVTFTVRNVTNSGPGTNITGTIQVSAIDTNNVVLGFNLYTLTTTDGGVTWRWNSDVFGSSGEKQRVAATESGGFVVGTNETANLATIATAANLSIPGGYRATTTAISAIRTGSIPYARVA